MNGKVHRPAARSIAKRLFVSGFRFCGSSEKQDRRYAVDCTSSKRGLRWMSIGVEDGEIKQKETKVTKCFGSKGRFLSLPKDLRFLCYLLLKLFSATPYIKRPIDSVTT
jgi:hypothetical protein